MTAILGANGTGKSTLVEAITFALYGEQRNKKESIRFHWSKGKRFEVILEFQFHGRTYCVRRTNSDASLSLISPSAESLAADPSEARSEARAHGLSETTRACERLLGLTYDQFINSFCAEQKGIAFLQFRSNPARQEEVARMLGYDRLRLAEELAGQRRREAASGRLALERSQAPMEPLIEQLRQAATTLKETRRALKNARQELKVAESASQTSGGIRTRAERWLALEQKRGILQGELAGLQPLISNLRSQVEDSKKAVEALEANQPRLRDFEEAEKELRHLLPLRERMHRRRALRELADELTNEIGRGILPDVGSLREQHRELLKEVERLELQWSIERAGAIGALSSAQTRLELAEQSMADFRRAAERGICPECGQPLADADRRQREREAKLAEAKAEVERCRTNHDCLQHAPPELLERRSAYGVVHASLQAAENAFAQLDEKRASLLKLEHELRATEVGAPSWNDVEAEFERATAVVQHNRAIYEASLKLRPAADALRERQIELEKAEQSVDDLTEGLSELANEQSRMGFASFAEASDAVLTAQRLSEDLLHARNALALAEERFGSAEQSLEATQKRVDEQRELSRQIQEFRSRELVHDVCAREMRVLRQQLNASVGPELTAKASENLALLTNGRYLALELDANFSASVLEDGVLKPVISGGEEDVVALALRLALAELIQERQGHPMSLLILDEVFGSLDVERRQAVLDRLVALRNRFDQILVISHIEDVHQVADHAIQLKRDPHSRATVVAS